MFETKLAGLATDGILCWQELPDRFDRKASPLLQYWNFMAHIPHVERVRQLVLDTLQQLGADLTQRPRETILVRAGYYCGRRFDCDGFQATWFFEEQQVKFHGRDGSLVKVCHPFAPGNRPHQRVA